MAASIEQQLQGAVFVDPVSGAPRLVYSDWLQERADPRAELMLLQLAKGELSKDQHARVKAADLHPWRFVARPARGCGRFPERRLCTRLRLGGDRARRSG